MRDKSGTTNQILPRCTSEFLFDGICIFAHFFVCHFSKLRKTSDLRFSSKKDVKTELDLIVAIGYIIKFNKLNVR